MSRKTIVALIIIVACVALAYGAWSLEQRQQAEANVRDHQEFIRRNRESDPRVRRALLDLLQPVVLTNCNLERFGEPNDGGYLMCGNLLGDVQAGYSYGIAGYDQWGCDISRRRKIPVHQYDCFNRTVPSCPGGDTRFHTECVGIATVSERDGLFSRTRVFDTIENQFAKNGDSSKRIVMKIDVEGAEWDSLGKAPNAVLDQIEQVAIEFHGVGEERFVTTVRRLREFFYPVHIHINNFTCDEAFDPFPGWAYEVLFVNKRLAKVDSTRRWLGVHAAATPNWPRHPDCQIAPSQP